MKKILPVSVVAITLVGIPLVSSADVMRVSGNSLQIAFVIAIVVIVGIATLYRLRSDSKSSDADKVLESAVQNAAYSWRLMIKKDVSCVAELESAICSFETFVNLEGSQQIIGFIELADNNGDTSSRMMLERAARVFPCAYQALDSRGKENQSTRIARAFFSSVIQEVSRDCAERESIAAERDIASGVDTGMAYERLL